MANTFKGSFAIGLQGLHIATNDPPKKYKRYGNNYNPTLFC